MCSCSWLDDTNFWYPRQICASIARPLRQRQASARRDPGAGLGEIIQREDLQLGPGEQSPQPRQLADPSLIGHHRDAIDLLREGYAKPDVGPQRGELHAGEMLDDLDHPGL